MAVAVAVVPLENCTGTGSAVAVLLAPSTSAVVMAVMGDHSTAGVSVVAHTVAVVMALPTVVGAGGYGKTIFSGRKHGKKLEKLCYKKRQ